MSVMLHDFNETLAGLRRPSEETVNSGLPPVVAVVWFVVAIAAVTAGWRRGNWILLVIGVLMIAVAAWNTFALFAYGSSKPK